jgi:diguanylate cyclase (GGDEF)-like protein/PAS domain S-box-containing protein
LTSENTGNESLRRHLLILFYRQGLTTQYLTLAAVAITVAGMWSAIEHPLLVGWGSFMVLLVSVRTIFMRRFLARVASITSLEPWEAWGLVGTTLGGISWGTLGLVYDNQWPLFYQVFLLVLLGGLGGISIASYSSSLKASMLFISGLLTPIFVRFLLDDSESSNLFVFAIIALVGCLYLAGRDTYKSITENVRLRLSNEQLIKDLRQTNADLNREIEHRIVAEAGLRQERKLFMQGPVMVFRWDASEGWPVLYASPNVSMWGLDAGKLVDDGVRYSEYVHPADRETVRALGFRNPENSRRDFVEMDYRIVLPDGETRWVFERTIPARGANGDLESVDGYLLDITDRKNTEELLFEEKERAQVTLDSIGDGVITTNNQNCVTYMNPIAEEMTGVDLSQCSGKPLERVFRALDQKTNQPIENINRHWQQRKRSDEMHSVRLGSNQDVAYSMAAIKDAGSQVIGSVVVLRDATRILALTRKLTYFASHDALTDTLNRREFERCLNLALKSATQQKITHVLLYIDIDQFKVINDSCGHHAGDELLQRISDLLSKNIRSGDVLARLGGDEFAILLQRCNLSHAETIAEKLRRTTHAARFSWENQIFEVSISIGAVEIDKDSENASVVLSAADMACYTAKDLGKDRIHVYRKTDAELNARRQEMHWVSHLNKALKQERLSLFQQEIAPVAQESYDVRRAEVLLRLFDADGRLFPARDFLPAIERYGLINAIDRWVVQECFSIIANGEASDTTIYAINISGSSMSQTDFLAFIKIQFNRYAVSGSRICFEITETSAVSHLRNARQFISELKSYGCYFALDDFGSGLSSFAYLKDLAVDFLKIDGSFVKNIVTDNVDRALVAAIKDVGHVMLIDTVAEHVENQAIMDVVKDIGIDYAQGSFVGHPVPFGHRSLELAGRADKQAS